MNLSLSDKQSGGEITESKHKLAKTRTYNHSSLFELTPIGIGTSWIEGLTGYIVRLADAHNVLPHSLVKLEILPMLKSTYRANKKTVSQCRLTGTWWRQISDTLNGLNNSTREWVEVLQMLTRRDNLKSLTMLTWSNMLSHRGLIRREMAWCSECYREWRSERKPLYSPLIWSLKVIKICSHHKEFLLIRCPYEDCQQTAPALGPRSSLGLCMYCSRWLGSDTSEGHQKPSRTELVDQLWIAEAIGGMLERGQSLSSQPSLSTFSSAVANYIEEELSGNAKELAHLSGLHHKSIYDLRDGKQKPQLGTFIRIAAVLGKEPWDLTCGKSGTVTSDAPWATADLNVSIIRSQRWSPAFDKQLTRQTLMDVVKAQEQPPPSMRAIARRLGHDQSFLQKHFPEECRAISERYQEHIQQQKIVNRERGCERIRQAVLLLHEQGVYPSHKRLRHVIGGALRDPFARQLRRELLQELGYQEVCTETAGLSGNGQHSK